MLGRVQRASDPSDTPSENGASAVEFALVLPLLMLFLLGIIQYGFGLYQLQSFTSVVNDASKIAGTGITSCGDFTDRVKELAASSGIDAGSVSGVRVAWLERNGTAGTAFSPASSAERYGLAEVTATFTPFRIGLVPFPSTITRTQTAPVTDTGLLNGAC